MDYIIYDLEFNQDIPSIEFRESKKSYPFEIIQIGAIKLDKDHNEIARFNRFVKPLIYEKISPFISELTGITSELLQTEEHFHEVYESFIEFVGSNDVAFCIWGMSDIKELYRNVRYHQLDNSLLSRKYINLQPYASKHLGMSSKKMIRLQSVVEALNIPMEENFHNALSDAYYTAEIFKKIYTPAMLPKVYDPNYVRSKSVKPKAEVNYQKLMTQFEKMYDRPMTRDEEKMIRLAYLMGKTKQFLKNQR